MTPMLDYHPMRRLHGTRQDYDRMVATICQECTVACGLCAYVREGRIVDVLGDETNPVSQGRLCARGTAFVRDVHNPERIVKPADRSSLADEFGELEGWEEALDLLADRLKRIRDQHGPETLCIECAAPAGLDFFYAAMRFAALWGTPHIFGPFRDPQGSTPDSLPNAPDGPCGDWIHSRCVLIVGADPAATHPVAFRRVLQAQKQGATVVVADTRFTKTMSKADMALRIRPDTANLLGAALMKVLLDQGLDESDLIRDRFTDAQSWQNSFQRMPLDAAAGTIGIPLLKLKETALLLSKRSPVQLITGRRPAQLPAYGIWRTMATAAGWTGKTGGGWYPLDAGRPPLNSWADMDGRTTEGGAERRDADSCRCSREYTERVAAGRVARPKVVIRSGDCLDELSSLLSQSAEGAPLTVYFGLVPNKASELSHMVFPAQAWAERDGLFFSNDRALLWGRQISSPPERAGSGLDFWTGLARRFGWEEHFPWKSEDGMADHAAFFDWLLDRSPTTRGCTSKHLSGAAGRGEFVHWPFARHQAGQEACPPLLAVSDKITPTPASAAAASPEGPDECFPLPLVFPDCPSRRVASASGRGDDNGPVLQIDPDTAGALGIETGDKVVVHGPNRSVEAHAWITRMVPRGLVYLEHGSRDRRVLVHKKGQSSQEALGILRELHK